MINAHCPKGPVTYCNEKKLYHFRIFEFKSEPFCEERNGRPFLSRSCDNVMQKLQAERSKRMSDSFPFHYWPRAPNRHNQQFSRTKSLPIDLSDCGQEFSHREHPRDDHAFLSNKYTYSRDLKRRINGFHSINNNDAHHCSSGMLKLEEESQIELRDDTSEHCKNFSKTKIIHQHGTNLEQSEVLVDEQFAKMNSNLNQLSTRYRKDDLESKSKDELISIVLELQDALKLVTD